ALLGARDEPGNFVFASGSLHTTGDWVNGAFKELGIDPAARIEINPAELHKGDRPHTFGNIDRTVELLGWRPRTGFEEIVRRLVRHEKAIQGAGDA
ncbi:GDP-mannose 4,6-dehydratase, partial [Candidatus Sumerlaeota bacterium]|nr:GDP-mannose 4,6-dehydratase [Candidatus Sumerlaeota bacterium]